MQKPKYKRTQVTGATAHASYALLQGMAQLLLKKGLITSDEWKNVIRDAAVFHKTAPNMNADQRFAADLLAALHIGLDDSEKGSKPN